jgi:DNA-binding response OmpR family regulator
VSCCLTVRDLYSISFAQTGYRLQNRYLAAGGIDIILLDLGLPDSQGLDTLRRVRDHAGEVPIVVLTMLDNEETGLNALKEGAQDYLVKGQMNGPLIARSLRYAIERGRIEKELKKNRDSLEELVCSGRSTTGSRTTSRSS